MSTPEFYDQERTRLEAEGLTFPEIIVELSKNSDPKSIEAWMLVLAKRMLSDEVKK